MGGVDAAVRWLTLFARELQLQPPLDCFQGVGQARHGTRPGCDGTGEIAFVLPPPSEPPRRGGLVGVGVDMDAPHRGKDSSAQPADRADARAQAAEVGHGPRWKRL